jgi:RNA polymerase sigma factor (sigma-70 family)
MEDASITGKARGEVVGGEVLGTLVSRIREKLRVALAFEAQGQRTQGSEEREQAETLMRRLEKAVAPKIASYAGRYFKPDQPDYEDAVLEMLGTLRNCVADLSEANRAFESMFKTCFFRKCETAIRDVRRRNGHIGKHALPEGASLVSLDDRVRGSGGDSDIALGDSMPHPALTSQRDSHDWLMGTEACERLINAIAELPTELQELCRLFYDGMTYEQIGAELNITPKTASARHSRAYSMVKERLAGQE